MVTDYEWYLTIQHSPFLENAFHFTHSLERIAYMLKDLVRKRHMLCRCTHIDGVSTN